MDTRELNELLGGWEGYRLGTVGRATANQQRGDKPEIWIELHPDPQHPRRWSGCGQVVAAIHETTARWVRDLPILEADTWLLVHRVRVNWPYRQLKRNLTDGDEFLAPDLNHRFTGGDSTCDVVHSPALRHATAATATRRRGGNLCQTDNNRAREGSLCRSRASAAPRRSSRGLQAPDRE